MENYETQSLPFNARSGLVNNFPSRIIHICITGQHEQFKIAISTKLIFFFFGNSTKLINHRIRHKLDGERVKDDDWDHCTIVRYKTKPYGPYT